MSRFIKKLPITYLSSNKLKVIKQSINSHILLHVVFRGYMYLTATSFESSILYFVDNYSQIYNLSISIYAIQAEKTLKPVFYHRQKSFDNKEKSKTPKKQMKVFNKTPSKKTPRKGDFSVLVPETPDKGKAQRRKSDGVQIVRIVRESPNVNALKQEGSPGSLPALRRSPHHCSVVRFEGRNGCLRQTRSRRRSAP